TAISPRLAISTLPIRRVPSVPVLVPTALSACCTPGPPPTTESFLLCSVGHSDRTQGESRITYRRRHCYRPGRCDHSARRGRSAHSARELPWIVMSNTRFAWLLRLAVRSEEHTSELQSRFDLVCRLLLE